ncbi:MAG: tetratricopeptide repeat protein, partial [Acidobacteriota bacterium]|nr:tetratricopeptide repeat protein [Acidobacteriota bacterium]
EEKYNRAIEINPNLGEAYYNLGLLLANDPNRWAEAEEKYNRAIEINPNLGDAYYNLACLNSLRHKNEKAFEYLKIAVEMDSNKKSLAKTDSDFDWIRDDERFAEIIKGEQ